MLKLYVVRGRGGVGKSGVCRDLAALPKTVHVYFEQFINSSQYAELGGKLTEEANNEILAQMYAVVDRWLSIGETVVLEGMCEDELVDQYQELAAKHNARFVSLVVEGRHGRNCVHDWKDDPILSEAQNKINVIL